MTVKLRKILEDDLEMIMNWRMLPEVTKYMYTDPKLTIENQTNWYKRTLVSNTEKYWIIQLDDGTDVGLLSLNFIDDKNKQCAWAYYIADLRARGKGLGRILECNIYDYVLEEMSLNKLWCEVFKFNDKVISIHQKFGSKIEGEFKDHIFKNGKFYDVVRLAIRKEEWELLKSEYHYEKIIIEK
jgi:UDP-4-amino-4,6-dideoxy-N-acetyl-beta-L-altrosamine N-acetyltransferase